MGESYADGRWWKDGYALNFVRYPPANSDYVRQEEAERIIESEYESGEAAES